MLEVDKWVAVVSFDYAFELVVFIRQLGATVMAERQGGLGATLHFFCAERLGKGAGGLFRVAFLQSAGLVPASSSWKQLSTSSHALR